MTDELSVAIEQAVTSLPAPRAAESPNVADIATARRPPAWIVPLTLVAADITALVFAFGLSAALAPPAAINLGLLALVFAASLPIWLVSLAAAGLYERDTTRINHTTIDELPDLLRIGGLGAALFLATAWVSGVTHPRVAHMLAFSGVAIVALSTLRGAARIPLRRNPNLRQRTLIVGAGSVGQLLGRKLLQHPEYGVDLLGFVDAMPKERRDDLDDLTILGAPVDLSRLVRELSVDRVVIAFSKDPHEHMMQIIRMLQECEVHIDIVPRLFDVIPPTLANDTIEGVPLIGLPRMRLSTTARILKRTFDLGVAALVLIPLAPVIAVIAALVKLSSPGPVLFRQIRMGAGEETFCMFKFRTMIQDADEQKANVAHLNRHARPGGDPRMFKVHRDPRITPIGQFLRDTSLDELPQLLNVLRGEMSLIGPRPLILDEDQYVEAWGRKRLALKPGMTGLWQVSGRSAIPFEEMVKLDYLYVTGWSLANDCRILLKTLPLVLRGDNNGG
jgi:exopolysaccharide biosynthesis polyprenyl glycosylphosphotransferase